MTIADAFKIACEAIERGGGAEFHGDITIRIKAGKVTAVDVRQTFIK